MKKDFLSVLVRAMLITILGISCGLATNALRADGLPLILKKKVVETTSAGNAIKSISLSDAHKALDDGSSVFLDARSRYDYESGHIPEAWNVEPGNTGNVFEKLKEKKGALIITYCSEADCHLAEDLARELSGRGLKNVYVMTEGWQGWKNEEYPWRKGR